MSLLEVVAMNEVDAEAAETGGADRIMAVADRQAGGLTPDPKTVAAMRKTTSLPIRVVLRAKNGFRTTESELGRLCRAAAAHADAGADGFVFGFLHADHTVDLSATARLADTVLPLPWTFHRAIDHAAEPEAAWRTLRLLRGLDSVLCAGAAGGVGAGMEALLRRAAHDARLMLVGGGLRRRHVPALVAAGVRAFQVGDAVRPVGGGPQAPVDAVRVREWRSLVYAADH
ncbi:copper homeostasis protein CutC [Actinoallomurus sp. NPDC052308]|uniref:copper homeostasis protein CutC n=1 Tax=Actinoallomurus sp. NPDC052308 TaxID=3155530 RepID=UPI003437C198